MRTGLYFGAGPAALATSVIEKAAAEFIDYENVGVGLGEMSHRSSQATEIVNTARAQIKQLLNVPDTHDILFIQGGGTGGFASCLYALAAYKLAKAGPQASAEAQQLQGDYIVTGSWSNKAHAEAQRLGFKSEIIGKPAKYTEIPPLSESRGDFVYYCDNETVHGVEFPGAKTTPPVEKDLVVCDISSNMFSRPIDVAKYAIIFGGAQKNLGIPGVSLYIVRKDILEAQQQVKPAQLQAAGIPVAPSFLDLGLGAQNNSSYNTVSIFAIEVIKLVTAETLAKGGIASQAELANKKAKLLYKAVDARQDVFVTSVKPEARSRMNVVFNLKNPEAEAKFLKEAAAKNVSGIKGHRSVGGIRISNYNAITLPAVELLVEFINNFK